MKTIFSKTDTLAIKGIAILLLLNYHNFLEASRYDGFNVSFFPFSESTLLALSDVGKTCVAMFVFLSAYGLTLSLKKYSSDTAIKTEQYKDYLLPRLIKLMWGFWFAFAVGAAACAIIRPDRFLLYSFSDSIYGIIKGTTNVLCDLFGLAFLFDSPTLNGTWWYMSVAIFIVLIVPFIARFNKKAGALATVGIVVFLPRIILIGTNYNIGAINNLLRYVFVAVLGVIFAQNDLMAKLKDFALKRGGAPSKIIKFLIATILLCGCYYTRNALTSVCNYTFEIRDGLIPVFIICYCYIYIVNIPVIHQVLVFLGKHSMNIFLIHTFIRAYFLHDFIYSFRHWLLIDLVLLACSIAVSIVMELIKKFTGYNRLLNTVLEKIENKRTEKVV